MAKRGPKGPSRYTKKYIDALAEEIMQWFEENENEMHLVSFCAEKGIPKQNMSEFSKKNRKFSEALKRVKTISEARILANAYKMRNPTMSIFDLKCNHGWVDKQNLAVEHSGNLNLEIGFSTVKDSEFGK